MYQSKNGKNEKGSFKVVKVILNEIDAYFCELKNKICTKTFDIFGACTFFVPNINAQRFSKHGNKRTISCRIWVYIIDKIM